MLISRPADIIVYLKITVKVHLIHAGIHETQTNVLT